MQSNKIRMEKISWRSGESELVAMKAGKAAARTMSTSRRRASRVRCMLAFCYSRIA